MYCSTVEREDFLRRVEEALSSAAAAVPITRLFVNDKHVPDPDNTWAQFHHPLDLVAAAISAAAARHVEELHAETDGYRTGRSLILASLSSSRVLRLLRVVGFGSSPMAATPPAATAAAGGGGFFLPMLVEIHLHKCSVFLADLQTTIDAAPKLATLRIESSTISYQIGSSYNRLNCPGVTDLAFEDCRFHKDFRFQKDERSLEFDVPGLKYFSYKGAIQFCSEFSLKSSSLRTATTLSNMIRADLHLNNDYSYTYTRKVYLPSLFWQLIQNFSAAKVLRIKMDGFSMDAVAPFGTSTLFHRLERLELDAQYKPTSEAWMEMEERLELDSQYSKASMETLASLLHCCPVLRDIRLKLSKDMSTTSSIDQVARADFDKSGRSLQALQKANAFIIG
ncbi:hypothetical protein HU200_049051 [Digitaria exilis]|uniref:Uncharacterized protein n=1 Tax=Digitaria exilis TaxID=1010633 RepID=A0A835E8T2_9POAL|nr:hypothetical protein HU200_049051 [Digitaria exilis]